jgi:hypothetical protein
MEEQLAAALAEMTRLKLRVDNAEIAWREESAWVNKAESRANKAESLGKKEKSRANKEEALRKMAKIAYLRVLASNILRLHNLTNSLAHLKTKYQPAKIIERFLSILMTICDKTFGPLPSFALVFTVCVEENVTSKAQFKQREQQKLEAYESKLAKTIKIK